MNKGWICLLLGTFLLVGGLTFGQKWQQVAVLVDDASRDETSLQVDSGDQIVLDKDVMIESRDGKVKQTYAIKHVYGHSIVLKEPLRHEFLSGSRLYQ